MKLEDVTGKYAGARIGVLGSGPTLTEYAARINELCDVVIACNGSLMALDPKKVHIDYFTCMDPKSPTRQWFNKSEQFTNAQGGPVIRMVPYALLPFDSAVIDSKSVREQLEKELTDFIQKNSQDAKAHRKFIPEGNIALRNGLGLRYETVPIEELDITKRIYGGGTITGLGAQVAWRMGAEQINLFGCGFNNVAQKEAYAYDNKGEFGETTQEHKIIMNEIILQIIAKGTRVVAFGETQLHIPEQPHIHTVEQLISVSAPRDSSNEELPNPLLEKTSINL